MTTQFHRPTLLAAALAGIGLFGQFGLMHGACAQSSSTSPSATADSASSPGAKIGSATLPPVEITGRRDRYAPALIQAGTRTDTPPENIPQSIVTLNRTLLQDEGRTTLSDALRDVSNVNSVDDRDAWNTGFKIRGFNATLVVDGVAMPGYFTGMESVFTAEQIDVIKGPAGGLFGAGQGQGSSATLGGTIAVSSRTADPSASVREVGLRLGSFGERAMNVDVNQPLGDGWAARLVGEVGRTGYETDGLTLSHRVLAPSLSWRPDGRTQVVLRLRANEHKGLDYAGLPTTGTLDTSLITLPRDQFITSAGQPENTLKQHGANLQWTQRVDAVWTTQVTLSRQSSEIDQRGTFLADAFNPNACFAWPTANPLANFVCGVRLWDRFATNTVSLSATAKLETGAARHTLQVGLDKEATHDEGFMAYANGLGPLDPTFATVPLPSPTYQTWVEPTAPDPADMQNSYRSTVVFAQDQVDLGAWHLLASLRHTQAKIHDRWDSFLINNQSSNSKLTPRVGAVYDWNTKVSSYAGVQQGMKVPTLSFFATPPKPETSIQKELGLRLKDFNGISGSMAWFDLARRNAAVADPDNPGFSVQTGLQRSRGVDLDLRWQASPGFSVITNATRIKARIEADGNPDLTGRILFNVPQRSARLAGRYEWLQGPAKGLNASLGITQHGRLAGDSKNTFFTPAATLFDAQVGYKLGNARYALRVDNLTDKQYFVPSTYFGGGQVIPARPRTVQATANFSF